MNSKEKSENYVPRITQLDASEFDTEIRNLLRESILEISNYTDHHLLKNIKPELNLIIDNLMFQLSLMKCNSSFGQQLLNVQYAGQLTRKKAFWFSLLNFFLPYLKRKYDEKSLSWNNEVKGAVDKIEVIIQICQLVNLMIFLRNGVYPNLVDRLLGLKIVPMSRLNRNVGYSYMTRELIWHGFMELFTFVLPLINYQYIKRKINKIFTFRSNRSTIQKSVIYDANIVCSICKELPIYPCRISFYCAHVACYYCIKSNVLADPDYICPICGVKNTHDRLMDALYIQ